MNSLKDPSHVLVGGSQPLGRKEEEMGRLRGFGGLIWGKLAKMGPGLAIGLLVLSIASGLLAPPVLAAKAPPDFALSVNYKAPAFVGHLVRGAVPSTPCGVCNGQALPQPAVFVPSSFGPFFDWNSISLVSLNDFSETVTLEVLNLPAGVTSLMPATLTVPRRGAVSTPFKLQAASGAALGDTTVTIRATSGALSHAVDLPVKVADQPVLVISPASVVGGNQAQGGALTRAAEADTAVNLSSSNPGVAQVPAGVAVRAGSSSVVFSVTTFAVSAAIPVTIAASFAGASSSFLLTVTPTAPPPPPPSADIVSVGRAEYDGGKRALRIEATSTSSTATLTVSVTDTGQSIGVVGNEGGGVYKGQLSWPVNPGKITIKSSLGGSATVLVNAK